MSVYEKHPQERIKFLEGRCGVNACKRDQKKLGDKCNLGLFGEYTGEWNQRLQSDAEGANMPVRNQNWKARFTRLYGVSWNL